MATITTYTLASGAKRLRVRYRTPEGKSTDKSGFTTKRDAQAFAATVEVSKLRGEYVAPAAGRVTVGDLGQGWLDRQAHLKPSHTRVLASTWANHIEPKWKDSRLTAVRTTDAQARVSELSTRQRFSHDPGVRDPCRHPGRRGFRSADRKEPRSRCDPAPETTWPADFPDPCRSGRVGESGRRSRHSGGAAGLHRFAMG